MVVRTNLAIRPTVKNSATNWFGPAGWARIAVGVHPDLGATTAFAGTTAGDVQADRATAVPGKWYVYSIGVRFVSASSGVFATTHWYTAGGVFLVQDDGNEYNQAGGSTRRLVSGAVQAPVDAATIRPNIFGLDGEAQLTRLIVEQFDTEAEALAAIPAHEDGSAYFDGDSVGAAWTGTNGSSTSTLTLVPSPSLAGTLASPVGTLVPHVTLNDVELRGELASPKGAIGLIVSVSYDDTRGRIRVRAQGFDPSVVRVVVSHRVLGTSRWTEVRGGRVATIDGAMVRTVDDYEFTAGSGMQYRIQGLSSSEGAPDVIVQTRIVTVADTLDESWLKFITVPYRNRKVTLLRNFDGAGRRARVALFDVVGKAAPVAVTDVHTGRTMTVQLAAHTEAEREALDKSLETGIPVFFQTPQAITIPSMYAVVGDYDWRPPTIRSPRAIFTVQLTEVSAPPLSIVGSGLTYAVLSTQYGSYADFADDIETYAEAGP